MKRKNIAILFLAFALTTTGCSDFLDKEPLDQGTDAIAYKNAEQFKQAANEFYAHLDGWKDITGGVYGFEKNLDTSGIGSNGGASAPEDDKQWGNRYSYIRNCNILLKKAEVYQGNKTEIAASVATARFFRAWHYFMLLKRFGGVPIIDYVLDVNSPELYGPRKSRYEVADFIIKDLKAAYPDLPQEKNIADADKGKVSKEAAKSFLARVLLHEATWEKYVPEIGFNLDGDGKDNGAGTAKPEGYLSVTDMLTQAKQLAKEVIDEANTGTFQLWNKCDTLSYYYLFSIDEKNGITNPAGANKSTNKEFIFSVKYDKDVKSGGIDMNHILGTQQGTNISGIFGESFLCRNGLPLRISYTGNMEDAQNNPQFEGWETYMGEYRNRDYRFVGCTYVPDRSYWCANVTVTGPCTVLGKPYPDPVVPKESYDEKDPAFSNKFTIYRPTLLNGGTHNGYGCRKYMPEGVSAGKNLESADFPLIRLAEVYLIYAEATCELGNGAISDDDLNFSINNTRKRAGVASLTNSLIADVWDAGYWDHKLNKTVCRKMTMLDEIRRERACELFGEGFREDDLKRWGIFHINLTGRKLGRHVFNSYYMTGIANDANYHGQPVYQPEAHPLQYGVLGDGNVGGSCDPNDPDYGRSIANLAANLLYTQRDYLAPIPLEQIRLNPQLTQNLGW